MGTEVEERADGRDPATGRWAAGSVGNPDGPAPGGIKVPEQLTAMRHAFKQDEKHDRTNAHRECRAWLKQDRKGFMAKMADLEKAFMIQKAAKEEKAKTAEPRPDSPSEEDLGATRVGELIERLLGEFNGGV